MQSSLLSFSNTHVIDTKEGKNSEFLSNERYLSQSNKHTTGKKRQVRILPTLQNADALPKTSASSHCSNWFLSLPALHILLAAATQPFLLSLQKTHNFFADSITHKTAVSCKQFLRFFCFNFFYSVFLESLKSSYSSLLLYILQKVQSTEVIHLFHLQPVLSTRLSHQLHIPQQPCLSSYSFFGVAV